MPVFYLSSSFVFERRFSEALKGTGDQQQSLVLFNEDRTREVKQICGIEK
jgi:hypothetical protein